MPEEMLNTSAEGMPAEIEDSTTQAQQAETLDSLMTEAPANESAEQAPAKEPGWIKGRIEKAVSKAEQRIREEYEAKLAPLYESIYDRQAEELVSAGEFKSLDRAKEYVRMKNGVVSPTETPAQNETAQARDQQGRFTTEKAQPDPVAQAKADVLFKQAQKINASRGVDVMGVFNSDETIRGRVLSGEWDFYDVADAMASNRATTAPGIVRSPNGGTPSGFDISKMSSEQFEKLQRNLSEGHRYDLRK